MTTDGSFIAGNIARSLEIDRTTIQTPRSLDDAQSQLDSEHETMARIKKAQSTEPLQKDRVRRERDQRRRQMERESKNQSKGNNQNEDDGPSLDLVA